MDLAGMTVSTPALAAAGVVAGSLAVAGSVYGFRYLFHMGQYAYHNSRLSTIGNPYITREEVMPLLEAGSVGNLARAITGDLRVEPSVSSFREADRQLSASFNSMIVTLSKEAPSVARPVVNAFIRRWEAEELKRVLRSVRVRSDPISPIGSITEEMERQILSAKDIASAFDTLESIRMGSLLKESLKGGNLDPWSMDNVLDRYVQENFRRPEGLPRNYKRAMARFSNMLADRYNLSVILRGKAAGMDRESILNELLSDGGTIGQALIEQMVDSNSRKEVFASLAGTYMEPYLKELSEERKGSDLELAMDRMMMNGSVALSGIYWSGVGPTIRYLVGKEMELRNLRVLLLGMFSGWDKERMRGMLVLEEGS